MDKPTLRYQFQAYRNSLSDEEYRHKSDMICQQIAALPLFQQAESVLLFMPLLKRREVDIRPLFEVLWQAGKRVVLPVMVDEKACRMEGFVLHSYTELVENHWGILEPPQTHLVQANTLDCIIAPALGADRQGFRLGYGKGYYDRFLKPFDVSVVVPVFAQNLVRKLPSEPHDLAANVVISENEVLIIS